MGKVLLLPAQTAPPDEALKRRHGPRSVKTDYHLFRDCLRWEFGFTCAICLLHERDIMRHGAEGWGVTTIEHIVGRAQDEALIGLYENLLYICRLCNNARNDEPVEDEQGRRLLDPTRDVWSEHFRLVDDKLIPRVGDPDAVRTEQVYRINEPRKVKLRHYRREDTKEMERLIDSRRAELARLKRRRDNVGVVRANDDIAALYRDFISRRGTWVPDDRPAGCRCGRTEACTLPGPYLRQLVEVDVPSAPSHEPTGKAGASLQGELFDSQGKPTRPISTVARPPRS